MQRLGWWRAGSRLAGVGLCRLALAGRRWAAAAQAPAPTLAIPVQATAAAKADVPVNETGLGNVQAFNTVTVKVRVDGELEKVDFVEGQMVKAGDPPWADRSSPVPGCT